MNVELIIFENPKVFRTHRLDHYKHKVVIKSGREVWDQNKFLLKKIVGGIVDRYFWKEQQGSYDLKTGRNVIQQVFVKSPDPIALKGWVPTKITTIGEMPEYVSRSLENLKNEIEIITLEK